MKMKLSGALFLLLFVSIGLARAQQPIDYVNPFVDTHASRWFYFSSASRPFGMVNLSPDTWVKGSWNSGYLYDSLHIRCFSHIHAWQMSGIPVMPTTGEFKGHLGMEEYKSSFTHDSEQAKPGYHKLVLQDYDITAELTSTCRVGFHRYTFPASQQSSILFDIGAYLGHGPVDSCYAVRVSDREIAGFSLMGPTGRRPKPTYVFFVARFNKPFENFSGWKDDKLLDDQSFSQISGENSGAYVQFRTADQEKILMKVGISYTSIEGARNNLTSEIPHWNFDKVKESSFEEWNNMLSRIKVKGGTRKERVKFYTDLWHALQGRRIVNDVDGKYCDMTGPNRQVKRIPLNDEGRPEYNHHQFDALWGTHWSLNILWSMVYPEIMNDFCRTMVTMYKDGGLIPRGPSGGNYTHVMIGDPAASFFACSYNKGIRDYDVEAAYEGLRKNAFPGGIRSHAGYEHSDSAKGGGMRYYVDRGYVPEGIEGSGYHKDGASMTLEYSYQDWCLAQMAKSMGKSDDYELFMRRSTNYRNLFNLEEGFIHPKNKDGSWIEDFEIIANKFNTTGFCESNSAIYTNFAPHDMDGLIGLFGGQAAYSTFLNRLFLKAEPNRFVAPHGSHASSYIDYENQPGTAMAHLFNYAGQPWLTQKWVRKIKQVTFGDTSAYGGYNGDEDQGQMGALGVLMSIGLFEVQGGASVEPRYEITSPVFDQVTIQLNKEYYPAETFTIQTTANTPDNIYIQSAQLEGKPLKRFWFLHKNFADGGTLSIDLGSEPTNWGVVE